MREIPLTQNKVAIVDDEDYERLAQHEWYTQRHKHTCYAVRTVASPMKNGKRTKKMVYMHQQVLGLIGVDHRNHNGLDNRRKNLRAATATQNARNKSKWTGASSRFVGVSWHGQNAVWRVRICVDQKRIYIGCFQDEVAAAKAYDAAARQHFGEFANTNF